MRRFEKGVNLAPADQEEDIWMGGHWTSKADNPQHNNLLSTKESMSKAWQICKQCMAMQDTYRDLDLDKSYLNAEIDYGHAVCPPRPEPTFPSTPAQVRTTSLWKEQVAEVNACTTKQKREDTSKLYGLVLNADQTRVKPTAFRSVPGAEEDLFENISIEIQHDKFLGPVLTKIYLVLFYMVRDPQHPNHLSLEDLNARMKSYPWRAVSSADIPPAFDYFHGRAQASGKDVYGDSYDGWLVPTNGHGLQWTAAMAINFSLHMIALLRPFIRDEEERMWKLLLTTQRVICWSLKWQSTAKEIAYMDTVTREQHKQFLDIPEFKPFYRSKDHNELHGPQNFLFNGPLRVSWAMKCEKFLRTMKQYGRRSNNKCLEMTMCTRYTKDVGHSWVTSATSGLTLPTTGSSFQHEERFYREHPFFTHLTSRRRGIEGRSRTVCEWTPIIGSWYRHLYHQGLHYTNGKMILYQHRRDGGRGCQTVGWIQSIMFCDADWWLVCYSFSSGDKIAPVEEDSAGLLQVDMSHLDTDTLVLVPVTVNGKPDGTITPLFGVESRKGVLILVEDV